MDDWDMGLFEKNQLLNLARLFYKMRGYEVEEDYDFQSATHPHEVLCWNQAKVAYVVLLCDGVTPTGDPDDDNEEEKSDTWRK